MAISLTSGGSLVRVDIAQIFMGRRSGNPSGISVSVGWQWTSTMWARTDGGGSSSMRVDRGIRVDHMCSESMSTVAYDEHRSYSWFPRVLEVQSRKSPER